MNKLSTQKRVAVISALVEGMSIRSVVRMTGVSKNTVVKLLADVGNACAFYQDKVFRNLTCKRIECDEIWSFVYAKERHPHQSCKVCLVMAMFTRGLRLMLTQS